MFVSTVMLAQLAQGADVDGAIRACGPRTEASSLCIGVFRATGNAVVAGAAEGLVVRPAKIALIMAAAWIAQRVVGRALDRLVCRVQGHEPVSAGTVGPADLAAVGEVRGARRASTITALLRSVSSLAIWTVAALMAMGELGLNLGPLIAGAGILGVAIGFGAQNLVKDFVSGIFMLIEDQYGVGDVIDAGAATGTVEGMGLRSTRLRDVNGTLWHLPSGQIDRVGNRSQQWSRAVLDVPVSYQTDLGQATRVIEDTARAMCAEEEYARRVLAEPEVWGVEDLGADSVSIRLVLKTKPNEQLGVARELRARIKRAFDEAGIEIPFPQRTVWHRVDEGVGSLLPGVAVGSVALAAGRDAPAPTGAAEEL